MRNVAIWQVAALSCHGNRLTSVQGVQDNLQHWLDGTKDIKIVAHHLILLRGNQASSSARLHRHDERNERRHFILK